jgi:hypothetical protein
MKHGLAVKGEWYCRDHNRPLGQVLEESAVDDLHDAADNKAA